MLFGWPAAQWVIRGRSNLAQRDLYVRRAERAPIDLEPNRCCCDECSQHSGRKRCATRPARERAGIETRDERPATDRGNARPEARQLLVRRPERLRGTQ